MGGVSGEEEDLHCDSISALKEELVGNVLGRETEIETKAGSQFQLDCRAEYFPEVTPVAITWKKEGREQFQCGLKSQLKSFGNASSEQIPQSLLRCFKKGEMEEGRNSKW